MAEQNAYDETSLCSALRHVGDLYGADVFFDEQRLVSSIYDLAPKLDRERKWVEDAYENGVVEILLQAHGEDIETKRIALQKAKKRLLENLVTKERAAFIVDSFAYGLGWTNKMIKPIGEMQKEQEAVSKTAKAAPKDSKRVESYFKNLHQHINMLFIQDQEMYRAISLFQKLKVGFIILLSFIASFYVFFTIVVPLILVSDRPYNKYILAGLGIVCLLVLAATIPRWIQASRWMRMKHIVWDLKSYSREIELIKAKFMSGEYNSAKKLKEISQEGANMKIEVDEFDIRFNKLEQKHRPKSIKLNMVSLLILIAATFFSLAVYANTEDNRYTSSRTSLQMLSFSSKSKTTRPSAENKDDTADQDAAENTADNSENAGDSDSDSSTYQAVKVTVTVESANVRQSPDTNAEVIETYPRGTEFTVVDETTGSDGSTWYEISVNSFMTGWIHENVIE